MSTWLSTGAGSAYGLDLELIKSPPSSSSTRTSHTSSSSPSSTISESSNSPLAISTRKPRTPRKRPNQTYNEAAALLSTVYPKIFSIKHLTKPYKSSNSSNFMLPFTDFESPDFLLYPPVQEKPSFFTKPKLVNSFEKSCQSPGEVESKSVDLFNEVQEDFDAESILDEEIQEEGVIDSIMGNLDVDGNLLENEKNWNSDMNSISCCGEMNPLGLGFGTMMRGVRAFRRVDDGNWWCFPVVDVQEISPRLHTNNNNSNNNKVVEKKKKKMSELMSKNSEIPAKETSNSNSKNSSASEKGKSGGLLLKLNYDEVLNAWSDKASPFPEDMSGSDSTGNNDVQARLAQINLFSENGGLREASVMRYKEKRRTRLFSKKIRYQVRKVNADQRPRMKGRFVRRPSSKEGVKGKKGSDKR